ncbi:hypothetical protein H70357_31055 [Paenibacillus sp. FSL H7-0357]|uniref:hypothetical protein n=1 Tax=Paenibacillus sp. FSL H7-0357 TaxID=1536774 RepID=UPI0004F7D074|nr:hypothetical protein [Paenibacillus sp. FSL H7-0357]AIQ20637.1 hypothetical protein H70357_31055 [Paenibacillus sp. FSL H7-0357]
MIGPIYLREGLVTKFKDHISSIPYCIIIHNDETHSIKKTKNLTIDEVNSIVFNFISAKYPIVCSAGSKSTIPFWDYHVALNCGDSDKDVFISELLVREPMHENMIKGILMAYFMVINNKNNYERLVVPIELEKIEGYEDITIEYDHLNNLTYLYKRSS